MRSLTLRPARSSGLRAWLKLACAPATVWLIRLCSAAAIICFTIWRRSCPPHERDIAKVAAVGVVVEAYLAGDLVFHLIKRLTCLRIEDPVLVAAPSCHANHPPFA